VLEHVSKRVASAFHAPGDIIIVLGRTTGELGGSQYLSHVTGDTFGAPPRVDLAAERALVNCLVAAAGRTLLRSAHDTSDGGLAVALAECGMGATEPLGFTVDLTKHASDVPAPALLFGEDQARVVVSVAPADVNAVLALAWTHGVKATPVGKVGEIGGPARIVAAERSLERPIGHLATIYEQAIPRRMSAGVLAAAGD
jgi:phosphoribosylformylglycinamidine synthase